MVPGKQYKPEDFLLMAWRRKWLIVVPFLLIASGTVLYSSTLPNLYKSESLILVLPQQVPRSYVASTVTVQIDQRLQTISQQVLSRNRLERLIEEFNLYPEARQKGMMEDVVQQMRDLHISVGISRANRDPNSGTSFNLGFTYRDPVIAMRVAERLTSMFIDANLKDRELIAQGTDQFIEGELIAARNRLEEVEKKIEDYRRKNPWDQAEEIENNRWAAVNTQQAIANVTNTVTQARERLLFLEKMVADLTAPAATPVVAQPTGAGNAPLSAAAQLEAAKNALQGLELRLKPTHPDIINAKKVIAELSRKAEQEALAAPLTPEASSAGQALPVQQRERLLNVRDEMDTLKRRIADGEAEERRLTGLLTAYQQRIENYPLRVREMEALTRDLGTIKGRYQDLLQKKESARISVNLEQRQIGEQMRTVEPARVPQRPVSPDRNRINLLGAALGLGLGVILAGFFEYRDTSLRTDDDVLAALALPVLALVPVMKTAAERRRAKRRRLIWSATGALTLVVSAAAALWTLRF
jgi:polysaccharide chain length determinant protein (PEP-CTERM system associated)